MSYCLKDSTLSDCKLVEIYNNAKNLLNCNEYELDKIFEIAIIDRSRFPLINSAKDEVSYLEHWIANYVNAKSNLPRNRVAKPKQACSDPAVSQLVKIVSNSDDELVKIQERHHNLFMSAENILGQLLEEYIAAKVSNYGWIWCAGNTLRAIDFCHLTIGYLQIKNKSNSENSSSSNIREKTNIKKWYRLGTKKSNGQQIPVFKWEDLNKIINSDIPNYLEPCNMNEDDYRSFLINVAKQNPKIISDL